jgi:hypothetical protein
MNRVLMKWSRELTRINQSYELNYFSNEVEEGASRNLHRPFHASALCLVGFHLGTQSISGTLTLAQLAWCKTLRDSTILGVDNVHHAFLPYGAILYPWCKTLRDSTILGVDNVHHAFLPYGAILYP